MSRPGTRLRRHRWSGRCRRIRTGFRASAASSGRTDRCGTVLRSCYRPGFRFWLRRAWGNHLDAWPRGRRNRPPPCCTWTPPRSAYRTPWRKPARTRRPLCRSFPPRGPFRSRRPPDPGRLRFLRPVRTATRPHGTGRTGRPRSSRCGRRSRSVRRPDSWAAGPCRRRRRRLRSPARPQPR